MMDARTIDELTEHDIMQMTPPQLAELVSLEECEGCAFADVCDGRTCLEDWVQKESDYRDERRQARMPL